MPLWKPIRAIVLAILKLASLCKAYRVQNFEQAGETSRVAIVRGGCQKKLVLKQRRDLSECLDELVVFAERRREQVVTSSTMRRSHGN
jgi:hypothetical protein